MDDQTRDLLERLRQGDPEAFNDVVRAHHGRVFGLARRLLRHTDDAQEVAQEAFLAAYQGIATFRGESGLGTWLLAIAYRKAADRARRNQADAWESAEAFEQSPLWREAQTVQYVTDWRHTPEQTYRQAEARALLDAALAKLPSESRAVFELRDLQGLEFREIADVLGIQEGTARVRLHRVRQFLLAELHGKLNGSGATR